MGRRRIRATVIGAGSAGTQIIRSLQARGVDIVGALELVYIGEDVGLHAGIEPLGIMFENEPEAVVARVHADVALIAIATEVEAIFELAKLNLEHGTNVITVAEDAFHPWRPTEKEMADQLHDIAVRNNVTFLATGMQDLFWHNCAVLFSSAVRNIKAIRLVSRNALDGGDTSPEILKSLHVGKSVAEFRAIPVEDVKEISTGPLYAIALDLGLTATTRGTVIEPVTASEDRLWRGGDLEVRRGQILGTREVTTVETAEGIVLANEFVAKLAEGNDADDITLTVEGEPEIRVHIEDISGFENTATIVVNRIPDVLGARAGYVTLKDLPRLSYKPASKFEVPTSS